MIRDAGGLAIVNLLWLVAGLGVTKAAGWWAGRGVLGALGISYLAGVAAYGVIAQTLLVAGVGMVRWEIVAVCAVLALGLLVPGGRVAMRGRPVWLLVPALVVALVFAVLAIDLWFQPLWAYDAWAFWTPKAHALAALHGLDASWFSQPALLNRDYPLLLPAVEAAGFHFTGYETSLLDLQSWLFALGLAVTFVEVVVPRSPRWSWAILILIVVAPSLADQLASAEADIPLASLFAVCAVCAFVWRHERSRPALVLFGVFAAGTAATKAEGLPFVLALLFAVAVFDLRAAPKRTGLLLAVGAGALGVAVVPWRIWVDAHGIPQQASFGRSVDVPFLAHRADRLPVAISYLLERLLDPHAWLLLVPLLTALTVAAALRGRRREALLVGAIVLLALASLVLAYWTSHFEIHYHVHTSARRVITGPILAWAFLVPLLWGKRDTEPATLTGP